MYEEFYNLKEKPFNLTPSSRYMYLSEGHKEALALLRYGVSERKGFILLTGGVGTGKTTVIYTLLSELDEHVEHIYVSNPVLRTDEFIDYLAFSAFKSKVHFKSKVDFLFEFEEYLRNCLKYKKNFVLIIDEAQTLSAGLLEEVRLLSNMESAEEKLISIFLVGQPELNEKLKEPKLMPLYQRISNRFHIPPLTPEDTWEYIIKRLKVAGADNAEEMFSQKAAQAVYEHSKGIPRMINILADNALLLGYSRGKKKITPGMISETFKDLDLDSTPPEVIQKLRESREKEKPRDIHYTRPRWIWAAVSSLIILAGLSLFLLTRSYYKPQQKEDRAATNQPRLADVAGIKEKTSPAETDEVQGNKSEMQESYSSSTDEKKTDDESKIKTVSRDKRKGIASVRAETRTEQTPSGAEKDQEFPLVAAMLRPEKYSDNKERTDISGGLPKETQKAEPANLERSELDSKEDWETITVKEGDYLAALAVKVYGLVDEEMLALIKRHNPEIQDINRIYVGQKIVFPPVTPTFSLPVTFTVHIASYRPFENARQMFQKLISKGYEAYILPFQSPQKERIYRITLGNFQSRNKAEQFASEVLERESFEYAEVIELGMK